MASILNAQLMNSILPTDGTSLFFLSPWYSIWIGRVNLSRYLEAQFDVEVTDYKVHVLATQDKEVVFRKNFKIEKDYNPNLIRAEYTTDGFLTLSAPLKDPRCEVKKMPTSLLPIQIVVAPLNHYTILLQQIAVGTDNSYDDD